MLDLLNAPSQGFMTASAPGSRRGSRPSISIEPEPDPESYGKMNKAHFQREEKAKKAASFFSARLQKESLQKVSLTFLVFFKLKSIKVLQQPHLLPRLSLHFKCG